MDFQPIVPRGRIDAMRAAGHWRDRLLIDFHDEAAARHPDKVALIDDNSMTGRRTVLSFRHLSRLSKRMALGLHALGVRRSDVVSVQLPNWWQFVALHLACLRIGACTNPVKIGRASCRARVCQSV